jgi:hypothetical protein
MARLDEAQVYQWWEIMKGENELVEVRLIGSNKTASGYFTNPKTLIEAVKPYTDTFNVYFTLNKIDPACYGREQRDRILQRVKNTTSDHEIIARDWVLIDLDAKRLSGVCSTKEEAMKAHEKGQEVYKFLIENGFNEPVVVFSSSGIHLYLRCALLNNEENTKLIKRFLNALSMIFSDEHVDCDCAVFNAARISRLPGSYSCKGANNDPTRPQRKCRFLSIPDEIKVNAREYFEKVANMYPEEDVKPSRENNYSVERFDLDAFIAKHGINVRRIESVAGGKKYVLDHCLFNDQHKGKDAVIFQRDSGAIAYHCFHQSCSMYTWRDVRKMFEPDAYDKKKDYTSHRSFKPRTDKAPLELQEKEEHKGNVWQTFEEIEDEDRSQIVSIPSGITQLDAECCGFDKPSLNVWSGNNGCVDCDTEYFNGERWVKISDYKDGDMVLQYNADGTASLVKPLKYHKYKCENLTLMTNATNSINQCLSDEHNVVYITSKGNIYKQNFRQFKSAGGRQCWIIPHFRYAGKGVDWTDNEIKLGLAISAEGHLFEHKLNKRHRVRVNLKHQYKKDELEYLLNACGIEYEKKKYCPKDLAFDTYLFYWDKAFKVFPLDWYNMSTTQLELVKSNVTKWDGRVAKGRGGTYSTTKKQNADFIQFCITSLGYRCSISEDDRKFRKNTVYNLHFSKNNSMIRCYKGGFEFSDYKTLDGYKYCFSVPSGMLVLRRDNAINITGNSAKSTLLNQIAINAVNQGFKVAIYSGELRGQRIKRWIVSQAAGKAFNKKSIYNSYDYYTPDNIKNRIVSWLGDNMFIYNTKYSHNIEQVCLEVETLVKEKQVDMLIMDNLSCLDIGELEFGVNEQQKTAVKMLLRLTGKLEIATHLVIHPKKTEGFLRKNDVSGAKALTDLADSVFFVHRWNQDTQNAAKEFLPERVFYDLNNSGTTNIVETIKHREFGEAEGHIYKLFYEPESRRLKNSIAENVLYGWYETAEQTSMIIPNDEFSVDSNPWGSGSYEDEETPF